MTIPTQEQWLKAHPYLEEVAKLQARIEAAAADDGPAPAEPGWERYAPDFGRGVPLLQSAAAGVDLAPAAAILRRLVERLGPAELPDTLAEEVHALAERFRADPGEALGTVRALAAAKPGEDAGVAGVASYLGWIAIARAIAPIAAAFEKWRDDTRWDRPTCPTCGAAPVLGQLVPEGAGRRRLLACGRCRTRWGWKRVACPFCTTENPQRLAVLEIENEGGFRLDVCDNCHGYLKTYGSQGNEGFMLADWSTLHLDVLAKDRGYERKGASLYDL